MVIVKEKDEYGYEKIVFRKGSTPSGATIAKQSPKPQEKPARSYEERLESAKRTVCWILRHGALKLGMNITSDGFVYLDDLIVREEFKKLGIAPDQIEEIVKTETKYYDIFTDNDSKVNVRAKWGHSMEGITTKYPTESKIEPNSQ
jgi:RNA:NAD 2'-phosphotransferase (TPT1/KptA family)